MSDKKANIVILSGPSGVGKRTIREKLDFDDLNMVNSISWTTRAPRKEDIEGVTYHFATPQEFDDAVKNDAFAEYARFANNAYGTPRSEIDKNITEGRNVMLEIEVNGAKQVMDKYPDALSIFLVPPTAEDLVSRLRGRGTEDEAAIAARLEQAKTEMALKDNYKHVVVNDDPDRAASEVAEIIRKSAA